MSSGMSFKAGRDMPIGMQEKMALQIAAGLAENSQVKTVAELPAWISVKDRLPVTKQVILGENEDPWCYEISEPVLGWDGKTMVVVQFTSDDIFPVMWITSDGGNAEILYWLPLPAPPEVN